MQIFLHISIAENLSAFSKRNIPGSRAGGEDWLFRAEYLMKRWLEWNGYSMKYLTDADMERTPLDLSKLEEYFFLWVTMNIGRPPNQTVSKMRATTENILLFSVLMKYTGKQDGKTVLMEQIHRNAPWFVIKKEHSVKMPVMGNAILPLPAQVYGGTVILLNTPVATDISPKMDSLAPLVGKTAQAP